MGEKAEHRVGLLALDGVQRVHGEAVVVGQHLLNQKHDGRDDDGDHADRGRKVVVDRCLAHVLLVNLHREGAVALADQKGRAEISQGPHEYHQGRGQNGGHAQRHHHLEKALDAPAAHVGGSL